MADRWFRVPQIGAGTTADPFRPETNGLNQWASAGQYGDNDFLVRVYGTTAELDALALVTGVTEVTATFDTEYNTLWTTSLGKPDIEAKVFAA